MLARSGAIAPAAEAGHEGGRLDLGQSADLTPLVAASPTHLLRAAVTGSLSALRQTHAIHAERDRLVVGPHGEYRVVAVLKRTTGLLVVDPFDPGPAAA